MNALDRMRAVLYHQEPAKVPFSPDQGRLARGAYTRRLRNRGMGMCTAWTPTFWSARPHVKVHTRTQGTMTTEVWETPAGRVSSEHETHLSRGVSVRRTQMKRGWIRGEQDYAPVVFAIHDERFYADHVRYDYATYDYGGDCLIKVAGPYAPYEASRSYFHGEGLDSLGWRVAQRDCPDRFAELLRALEAREERRLGVLLDSPGEVIGLRGLSEDCSPQAFEEHIVPFARKCVPSLQQRSKIVALETTATRLSAYKDLIPLTGVDVIDGFSPPPVGDLPLEEARAAWGERMVIWVDFPEQVLRQGPAATREYTLDLMRSDPGGALILGMTTGGSAMAVDDVSARTTYEGMMAVLEAIDAYSARRT